MKNSLIKLYDWSNEHTRTFLIVVFIILGLCSIGGYFFTSSFWSTNIISEEEFKYLEQVAQNATLYEIPEKVTLVKDGNEIEVGIKNRIGSVIMRWENSNLVLERNYEKNSKISSSLVVAFGIFLIGFMCFMLFVLSICRMVEKERGMKG